MKDSVLKMLENKLRISYNFSNCSGILMRTNTQYYGFCSSLFRTASSLINSLYYKITSILYQCLAKADRQRECALLSDYYFDRASAVEAYFLFGNDLISPIVNFEKVGSLVRPLNLRKIDTCFNEAMTRKPAFVQLERSKFPKEKITHGICVAFALKFISKFLQAIQLNQDASTTIRLLAEKFKEGGSERTGIVHGIQSTIAVASELGFYQTLANLFRVELSRASLCMKFTGWDSAEEALTHQLNQLEDGVYFISEQNKNPGESGHAIAYIKLQSNHFLFDSQLGVVQIPNHKDAEYLIKSLKYASGDQLTLYKASLQE